MSVLCGKINVMTHVIHNSYIIDYSKLWHWYNNVTVSLYSTGSYAVKRKIKSPISFFFYIRDCDLNNRGHWHNQTGTSVGRWAVSRRYLRYLAHLEERHSAVSSADRISADTVLVVSSGGGGGSLVRRIPVTGGIAFQNAAHSGMQFPSRWRTLPLFPTLRTEDLIVRRRPVVAGHPLLAYRTGARNHTDQAPFLTTVEVVSVSQRRLLKFPRWCAALTSHVGLRDRLVRVNRSRGPERAAG